VHDDEAVVEVVVDGGVDRLEGVLGAVLGGGRGVEDGGERRVQQEEVEVVVRAGERIGPQFSEFLLRMYRPPP